MKRSFVVSLISGLFLLMVGTIQPALTQAAEYYCGSQCNGKAPTSPIASNGVVCKNSARQIAAGHPSATYDQIGLKNTYNRVTEQDTAVTVKVMYSSVCQTMWAVVTNAHGGVPSSCSLTNRRTASPTWSGTYACPGAGTTRTYPMVNDYISSKTVAARVSYSGSLTRTVCRIPLDNYRCQNSSGARATQPVAFTYTKAY